MIIWNVNWLAVFVAAVISMAIGMFWYSPRGFGEQWIKLSKAKLDAKKNMNQTMFISFIATLITSFMLANFVKFAEATTLFSGAQTGFLLWLGFVAPVQLGIVLWENKPTQLFVLNTAHNLVSLAVMGAILAIWI